MGGSPDGPAPAASSSAGVAIGRVARTDLYRMTVQSVRECPPTAFEEPEKGHLWLGVDVELEALGDTPVPANPFYAKLDDGNGKSYRARFGGCKPAFGHPPLSGGATAHGLVTFEIAERASGLHFGYDPRVPGHAKQEVRFELGR